MSISNSFSCSSALHKMQPPKRQPNFGSGAKAKAENPSNAASKASIAVGVTNLIGSIATWFEGNKLLKSVENFPSEATQVHALAEGKSSSIKRSAFLLASLGFMMITFGINSYKKNKTKDTDKDAS